MSGTHTAVMGDQGGLVIPAELRVRLGFEKGSSLIFMESAWGLVVTSREALLARIQSELEGGNLVEELMNERRREATIEDAG